MKIVNNPNEFSLSENTNKPVTFSYKRLKDKKESGWISAIHRVSLTKRQRDIREKALRNLRGDLK